MVCDDYVPLPTYAKCMKDYYGEYILHEAAIEGKLELIKYLHKNGAFLNKKDQDGETPMLLAALKGHWNIVYYLHEKIGHKKKKTRNNYEAFQRVL